MDVTIHQLGPEDEGAAPELVGLINHAYERGEAGLWVDGFVGRTDEAEITEAIRAGHMLVARVGGRIVGCLRTRPLDPTRSDVGLIAVDPSAWGAGTARALLDTAEKRARTRGATTMQLELLVPRTGAHPDKQRLHDWYTRRGYTITRRVAFEAYVPRAAHLLAARADILIFTKALR